MGVYMVAPCFPQMLAAFFCNRLPAIVPVIAIFSSILKTTRGYRQIGPNVWTVVYRGERLPFSPRKYQTVHTFVSNDQIF